MQNKELGCPRYVEERPPCHPYDTCATSLHMLFTIPKRYTGLSSLVKGHSLMFVAIMFAFTDILILGLVCRSLYILTDFRCICHCFCWTPISVC
jgi:hypothetical protein